MAPLREFLQTHWFDLVQTFGILAGLLFTGITLRREGASRRLSNLLALKQEHRELWNTIHQTPELSRILNPEADLLAHPMTPVEQVFLRQVIVHVATSWQLMRQGTPLDQAALRNDVGQFFRLPLPRQEWQAVRKSQTKEFATFIEKAAAGNTGKHQGS